MYLECARSEHLLLVQGGQGRGRQHGGWSSVPPPPLLLQNRCELRLM